MSVLSYIDELKAKPMHVRKRYAFWSSFGVSAVIFAFWIGSFTSFGATSQDAIASAASKIDSPAQSLVASVGSFFVDIKDILFAPKKVTYTSLEVTPGKK